MGQQPSTNVSSLIPSFIRNFSHSQEELDLSFKQLTRGEISQLSQFLQHIPNSITKLKLDENEILGGGGRFVREIIQTTSTLLILSLERNGLGNEGIEAISKGLIQNTTLQTIDLQANGIGKEGGKYLGEMLQINTTLLDLFVDENNLQNEGVKAISKGIACNSTLETLDISDNNITSEGIECLCAGLLKNSSITKLDMRFSVIGNKGYDLARVISLKTQLIHLYFEECHIEPEASKAIFRAVGKNSSLVTLFASGNILSRECIKCIRENKSLVDMKIDMCEQDVKAIIRRNVGIWKERMRWSFRLNFLWRVLVLGGCSCDILPVEMIYYILGLVVPREMLIREEMRKVMKFANNILNLGKEKEEFLKMVFGERIEAVLEEITSSLF